MSRLIDADALMDDINTSINEMTKIGITVDGEWLWAKLNDAIENAPTITGRPTGQWVPVAERLPDAGELVLIRHYSAAGNHFYGLGIYDGVGWDISDHITHWMPLPEPLEEET